MDERDTVQEQLLEHLAGMYDTDMRVARVMLEAVESDDDYEALIDI